MLKTELDKYVTLFNNELDTYLHDGNPKKLYDASKHLPFAGGKRLRPCITMLSCESLSGDNTKAIPYAAALELLHNFTLVHDDIMDNSNLRRNIPTVHVQYGEPTAILAGDYLFAKSFEAAHKLNIPSETFKQLDYELIECIKDICRGQQLDMEFEKRMDVTESEYIDMIQKKTAVLFRLSSRGGAIIGGGNTDEIAAFTSYGLNLGLGFQIWDDYLDLSSDEETLGKDIGNDIRNGKKTLIAVNALENATSDQKSILTKSLGNNKATDDDIKETLQLFRDIQSIDYAKNKAIEYSNKAKTQLELITDSPAKQLLIKLADYSIQREK